MALDLTGDVPYSGNIQGAANTLSNIGGQQTAYGSTLEQPILTGVLPTGAAQLVDQILQAQQAGTRQTFGKLGLGTSSMETSAENQNLNQSLVNQFNIEQLLAKLGESAVGQGISADQASASLWTDLSKLQIGQDAALMDAIGKFAGAIGGAVVPGLGKLGGGASGSGSPATIYPDPNNPGGYAPGYG